jgi:hypothetical protein
MDVIEPPVHEHHPAEQPPVAVRPAQNKPGQLTHGWKSVFIGGWVAVMAGFGAIAQGGRIGGISPWWLGPESEPKPFFVIALPFLAPVIVISLAWIGSRFCCYVGIVAALATAAVGLGDLRWPGLAIAEAVIGAAALAISCACLGGRFRRPAASELAPPR